MSRTSTFVIGIAMLLAVAAFSINPANAHTCSSKDPAYNCGACVRDEQGSEIHMHTYDDGTVYCESEPCHWKEGCPEDARVAFLLPAGLLALLAPAGGWA
jgi:hypothetical protein